MKALKIMLNENFEERFESKNTESIVGPEDYPDLKRASQSSLLAEPLCRGKDMTLES